MIVKLYYAILLYIATVGQMDIFLSKSFFSKYKVYIFLVLVLLFPNKTTLQTDESEHYFGAQGYVPISIGDIENVGHDTKALLFCATIFWKQFFFLFSLFKVV